jgi:Ca-activated chloride channel family protein
MEALADNGNGVYYYIDGETEAERIFGSQLLSTLQTVANDVKLQIAFDPAAVASYRLIGYENRILNKEDFTDDTKDAGEVGAGHQVTVCYELTPAVGAADTEEWMTLKVRYKPIGTTESVENEYSIGKNDQKEPDGDFKFITAVIKTAMILHNSKYLGDIDLQNVLDTLDPSALTEDVYREEFKELIQEIKG